MEPQHDELMRLARYGAIMKREELKKELSRLDEFIHHGKTRTKPGPKPRRRAAPHWTQTPEGKKRLRKRMLEVHAAKRRANS